MSKSALGELIFQSIAQVNILSVWVCSCSGIALRDHRSKRPVHFALFGHCYLTLKVIDEGDIFRETESLLLDIVPYQMINC
jgi:hypothetical protein